MSQLLQINSDDATMNPLTLSARDFERARVSSSDALTPVLADATERGRNAPSVLHSSERRQHFGDRAEPPFFTAQRRLNVLPPISTSGGEVGATTNRPRKDDVDSSTSRRRRPRSRRDEASQQAERGPTFSVTSSLSAQRSGFKRGAEPSCSLSGDSLSGSATSLSLHQRELPLPSTSPESSVASLSRTGSELGRRIGHSHQDQYVVHFVRQLVDALTKVAPRMEFDAGHARGAAAEAWAASASGSLGQAAARVIAQNITTFQLLCASPSLLQRFHVEQAVFEDSLGNRKGTLFSLRSMSQEQRHNSHSIRSRSGGRKKSIFMVNDADEAVQERAIAEQRRKLTMNASRMSIAEGALRVRASHLAVSRFAPSMSISFSPQKNGRKRNNLSHIVDRKDSGNDSGNEINHTSSFGSDPRLDKTAHHRAAPGSQPGSLSATMRRVGPQSSTVDWRADANLCTKEQHRESRKVFLLQRLKKLLELIALLICIFNFVTIPTRIAIGSEQLPLSLSILEGVADLALIAFSIAQLFLPVDDRGHTVMCKKRNWAQYMWSRVMALDVATLAPFQVVILPVVAAGLLDHRFADFSRINRMLGLVSFSALFDAVAEWWLAAVHPLLHRLIKFIIAFFVYVFITAAPVMIVFRSDLDLGREWLSIKPRGSASEGDGVTGLDFGIVFMYVLGITAGRNFPLPISEAQVLVMALIGFMGMGSMGVIITGVTSMVLSLVERSSRLTTKLVDVTAQLEHMRVSPDIIAEICGYYGTMFKLYNTFGYDSTGDALDELPLDLRTVIEDHINAEVLKKVSLFSHVSDPGVLRAIADGLEMYLLMPGTVIAMKGEEVFDMFFIARGTAAVASNTSSHTVAELSAGAYFGQSSLLFSTAQHRTVTTKTVVQLFVLSRENFHTIMEQYPVLMATMLAAAQEEVAMQLDAPQVRRRQRRPVNFIQSPSLLSHQHQQPSVANPLSANKNENFSSLAMIDDAPRSRSESEPGSCSDRNSTNFYPMGGPQDDDSHQQIFDGIYDEDLAVSPMFLPLTSAEHLSLQSDSAAPCATNNALQEAP